MTPPAQPPDAAPASRRRARFVHSSVCALIIGAVLAAYSNALRVPFVFDDKPSITGNPTLGSLLGALAPPIHRTVSGRPFLNLTFAVNHMAGGVDVWGYHALNLAIHAASAVLVFGIVRRTLEILKVANATPLALSVGLLWALHPIQTSAVTYVAQRAESMMGLLYLLALYGFIRGASGDGLPRTVWQGVCVCACLLGMATKEVMVSAPLVILLYDRTFIAGSFRGALGPRRFLYAALASTWILLAWLCVTNVLRTRAAGPVDAASPSAYLVTQCFAIPHYLGLCLWPAPLVFDYGPVLVSLSPKVAMGGAFILGILGFTVAALLRGSVSGFLGAAFFLILAPTSSVLPVSGETIAEYRMYLPSVLVTVAFVIAVGRALGRYAPLLCITLAVMLGVATHARNAVYSSELSVWEDTVRAFPQNFRAHNNLAGALSHVPGRQSEALEEYAEAVRIKPDAPESHVNLGNALSSLRGRQAEAEAQYREAIRLEPRLFGAHVGLGNLLSSLPGRGGEAISEYRRALDLNPGSFEAHFDLGNALSREPEGVAEAAKQYRESVRLNPDFAKGHFALAVALLRLGAPANEVEGEIEQGLRTEPNDRQALRVLQSLRGGGR